MAELFYILKNKRGRYLSMNRTGNFARNWALGNAVPFGSVKYAEKIFNTGVIGKQAVIIEMELANKPGKIVKELKSV